MVLLVFIVIIITKENKESSDFTTRNVTNQGFHGNDKKFQN